MMCPQDMHLHIQYVLKFREICGKFLLKIIGKIYNPLGKALQNWTWTYILVIVKDSFEI